MLYEVITDVRHVALVDAAEIQTDDLPSLYRSTGPWGFRVRVPDRHCEVIPVIGSVLEQGIPAYFKEFQIGDSFLYRGHSVFQGRLGDIRRFLEILT